MCGIILLAGNLEVVHEKALRTLLVLDSIRGEDSTGILKVGKFANPDIRIAKQVGDPFQLFEHKAYDQALTGSHRLLLGHNRWATVGGISRATAHPFENDTLIGVHNGTLKNKHVLDKSTSFKVDSENLFHHMSKFGLDDALGKIDGAWALVWWDKTDSTVNILRNKERPLWWTSSANAKGEPDFKCFFAASEPWMLRVALSRHGIAHSDIEEVEVDKHFKITIHDGGALGKVVKTDAPGRFQPIIYQNQHFQSQQKPTTAVSNVVAITKTTAITTPAQVKEDKGDAEGKKLESKLSSDTSCGSSFDRVYLRQKNVLFELMEGQADKDGCEYLTLFDPKRPYYEIRLYPESMQDTIWEMVGCEIQADISMWVPGETPGKGYYKVRPAPIRVLASIEEVKDVPLQPGASGRMMDIREWQRAYPVCSWCTSPLEFGQAKFTTASEAFCPDCAKNPQVTELVNF